MNSLWYLDNQAANIPAIKFLGENVNERYLGIFNTYS